MDRLAMLPRLGWISVRLSLLTLLLVGYVALRGVGDVTDATEAPASPSQLQGVNLAGAPGFIDEWAEGFTLPSMPRVGSCVVASCPSPS